MSQYVRDLFTVLGAALSGLGLIAAVRAAAKATGAQRAARATRLWAQAQARIERSSRLQQQASHLENSLDAEEAGVARYLATQLYRGIALECRPPEHLRARVGRQLLKSRNAAKTVCEALTSDQWLAEKQALLSNATDCAQELADAVRALQDRADDDFPEERP